MPVPKSNILALGLFLFLGATLILAALTLTTLAFAAVLTALSLPALLTALSLAALLTALLTALPLAALLTALSLVALLILSRHDRTPMKSTNSSTRKICTPCDEEDIIALLKQNGTQDAAGHLLFGSDARRRAGICGRGVRNSALFCGFLIADLLRETAQLLIRRLFFL
jgi:hypothetical protein